MAKNIPHTAGTHREFLHQALTGISNSIFVQPTTPRGQLVHGTEISDSRRVPA